MTVLFRLLCGSCHRECEHEATLVTEPWPTVRCSMCGFTRGWWRGNWGAIEALARAYQAASA